MRDDPRVKKLEIDYIKDQLKKEQAKVKILKEALEKISKSEAPVTKTYDTVNKKIYVTNVQDDAKNAIKTLEQMEKE